MADSPYKGRVLIVAGSDSGGGAGIQADIKTVTMLGGYAATAITALTAQNTLGVQGGAAGIYPIPADFVQRQMSAVLDDIGADAIKTGMLFSAEIIEAVAAVLSKLSPLEGVLLHGSLSLPSRRKPGSSGATLGNVRGSDGLDPGFRRDDKKNNDLPSYATAPLFYPLILDPVMVAKGGHPLLKPNAVQALKDCLIPHAAVLTPNIPEAELLLGRRIQTLAEMRAGAEALLKLGARAVLLKGGHLEGETLYDVLAQSSGEVAVFEGPRIASVHTHGTGCTLASAIACGLAQGMALKASVERARQYVRRAIVAAPGLGAGHGPLGHGWPLKSPLPLAGEG